MKPKSSRYTPTERKGVNAVEGAFLDFGWIFREQHTSDIGIDAQVELIDDDNVTGKLIAIQIKSGEGNFTETKSGYRYYGSLAHYDYWLSHSLPVLLIAHIPRVGKNFWMNVSEKTAKKTQKGWSILIPKENILDKSAKNKIRGFFQGSEREQRLRRLALDEPIMQRLAKGQKIVIEFEDWINKSLGRSEFTVSRIRRSGDQLIITKFPAIYSGRLRSISNLIGALFPWADAEIDEDFYEEHSEDRCDWVTSRWTEESDYYETRVFYPYGEEAGEAELYRLQLTLNDLGKAYLLLSQFLTDESIQVF